MAPPPERPEATRGRTYIILSFWVVILFLGYPTWWKTTSIPRAGLPVVDMAKWETEQPAHLVHVRISVPRIPCADARRIVSEVQTVLDQRNEFDAFQIQTHLVYFRSVTAGRNVAADHNECGALEAHIGDRDSALDITLTTGDSFALDISGGTDPALATFAQRDIQLLGPTFAERLRQIFADERAAVAYQYYTQGRATSSIESYVQTLPQETIRRIERDAARAFKPAPEYHLTFSLFTAGGTPSGWDIEPMLKQNIQPLIHSLSSVAKIHTTTQLQMYSAFSSSIHPFEEIDEEGWFLREQELTAFINTAEWPLSPSIGSGPTLNFISYVPEQNQLPLRIENEKGTSWIVPQWGAITILNPPLETNPVTQARSIVPQLDSQLLQAAFETFRSQLLTLLGIPSTPDLPLELRLRSFRRLAGLSLYLRTSSNLASLARLSQRLHNIPIPHHAVRLVEVAISGLQNYQHNQSLPHVRASYRASEKAFFDKSMVGQVYFPDEHKVAVYLPLLGPIGVPLAVALLREVKQFLGKK